MSQEQRIGELLATFPDGWFHALPNEKEFAARLEEQIFVQQRWDVIPGAEASAAFSARVRAAISRIAGRHPDQCVAVFTHGGVIGQVLADATSSRPFAFTGADNGSISHVVVDGDRWIIRRFNEKDLCELLSQELVKELQWQEEMARTTAHIYV